MGRIARVVGKAEIRKHAWLVPIVTGVGVTLITLLIFWFVKGSSAQLSWQPYVRTDADYAIDMPADAQSSVTQEQTSFGPTTVQKLQCQLSKPRAVFTVLYSPFPANSPFLKMTSAQADAALTQFISRVTNDLDGKLIERKDFLHQAGIARSFRIQLAGKQQYHGRILYLGPGQYQLSVIAPDEAEVPAFVPRFLNSFEYRGKTP